ncbi:MAG: hypothetical protein RLZZ165_1242 [Bacteroidota bacterium]
MSRQHLSVPIILATIFWIAPLLISCKRDKCKKMVCLHGSCMEGICSCQAGYFGRKCGSVINAGYDGTWNLTENCTAGTDYYSLRLLPKQGSLTGFRMVGLWEQADTLEVESAADGFDFSAQRQRVGTVDLEAWGTSVASRDTIQLHYKAYQIGQPQAFDQCTATLLRQ